MGAENTGSDGPSSAHSRETMSRKVASVMRLGGHMRLVPETGYRHKFKIIEAVREAANRLENNSAGSISSYDESEEAGLDATENPPE